VTGKGSEVGADVHDAENVEGYDWNESEGKLAFAMECEEGRGGTYTD
jgi:hypothetical protein